MAKSMRLRRLTILAALLTIAALAPLPTTSPGGDAAVAVPAKSADACGPRLPKKGGGQWRCSFVENFRGKALNRKKWIVQDTRRTGFWSGDTCYTPGTDNVKVWRGRLVLRARKGPLVNCGTAVHSLFTRYTGGMVGTKGYFSQTYGRFEVRAKYPTTNKKGVIGGFWMNPATLTYGRWPESGEIDVAEWWSKTPTQVIPSLHYDGRVRAVDSGFDCRVRTPTQFHKYTLIWRPTVMRFYIDGKQCFARSWTPDPPQVAPQPFDHPFSMIVFVGVPRRTGRHSPTPETKFPARYVVDYAKAWR